MELEFEWDDEKRLSNLEKHGIDFFRMRQLFDGRPVFTADSPRGDERRFLTTGVVEDIFYTVIWTERGEKYRFISARRARDAEERAYRQLYGKQNR
jgi:uncharacterized DUF497 family protein